MPWRDHRGERFDGTAWTPTPKRVRVEPTPETEARLQQLLRERRVEVAREALLDDQGETVSYDLSEVPAEERPGFEEAIDATIRKIERPKIETSDVWMTDAGPVIVPR